MAVALVLVVRQHACMAECICCPAVIAVLQ